MKTSFTAVALTICSFVLPSAGYGQTTAIVGATVIDGTGANPISNAVIVIAEKKIVSVGKKSEIQIPADAKVISEDGKFVIPGLIDTNVHLILNLSPAWLAKYDGRFEDVAAEAAQISLKNGVTTVFDSWGPLQPLLNVRDRIRSGALIGSRLYVAGNIVGLSGPLGRDFQGGAQLASVPPLFAKEINPIWEENVGPDLLDDTPEEIRAEIRKYIARGIDFIKFAEASHNSQGAKDNWLMFSPEAARAIVEEGHAAGLIVQTHTMNVESLRLAVLAGIDMGQHPEVVGAHDLPDDLVKLIVERPVYCGDLSYKKERVAILNEIWNRGAGGGGFWSPDVLEHWQANIAKLIRAGAHITLATDGGTRDPEFTQYSDERLRETDPTEFGKGHFLWLESIVEKGMTPMQAIVSATRNGAAAYHHLSEFGTLESNKFADLIVLDADPLENISNVRRISLVMKEGKVVDRDRLPEHKVLTR